MVAVQMDVGSSEHRAGVNIDVCGTLTHTGCKRNDYWVSTKGGVMSVEELERLQGIPQHFFDYKEAGISQAQYRGMIGNAMSWPVVAAVIASTLRAAGIASDLEYDMMTEAVHRKWQ